MNIGLIGFGTVGEGVWRILEDRDDLFVKYVVDKRDLPPLGKTRFTKDLEEVLNDPEVDTVVELIGGLHPAYEFISSSLKKKKNVVTANKYLLSLYYKELVALAEENGVTLRFTAAAGGGIPWLVNLQRAARACTVNSLYGIMNGTTNFILDAMQTGEVEFDDALKEAQRLGFAEADPSMDIDGWDTCHKIALSANIAFGTALKESDVDTFGIRFVRQGDLAAARNSGRTLKLIGRAERTENGRIAAFVEPALCPLALPESHIHGCDNILSFEGTYIGKTSFVGPGAGRFPTGYAVAQDLLDLAENAGRAPLRYNEKAAGASVSNDLVFRRYYLRTDFCSDPFFASLHAEPWGEGVRTEKVSVKAMHDFAARAKAAGKTVFFAGFLA